MSEVQVRAIDESLTRTAFNVHVYRLVMTKASRTIQSIREYHEEPRWRVNSVEV